MANTYRRSGMTEQDRADWEAYARSIVPLPGHELPAKPGLPPVEPRPPVVVAPTVPARPAALVTSRLSFLTVGVQPPGLDAGTWSRLRMGKILPSRTLDLHGRSAQQAFHSLRAFLEAAVIDRLRCVEVITGRGSGPEGGVIRRELPMWLNLPNLRPMLLGAAYPHAANLGSVRLLLRRQKAREGEAT